MTWKPTAIVAVMVDIAENTGRAAPGAGADELVRVGQGTAADSFQGKTARTVKLVRWRPTVAVTRQHPLVGKTIPLA